MGYFGHEEKFLFTRDEVEKMFEKIHELRETVGLDWYPENRDQEERGWGPLQEPIKDGETSKSYMK